MNFKVNEKPKDIFWTDKKDKRDGMKVITESLLEGAKRAKGLVVIIDVFRAFTTAAYVMNNGARKIIPVGSLDEAFELKRKNPDFILIGERNGLKVEGFDHGNSPAEIQNIDFTDKTVIQTTSAGTQGILNAKNADEILLCSFVNIQSTIDYIKKSNPEIVTMVSMGTSGVEKSDEDELCAGYIKDSLEGKKPDFSEIKSYLRTYKSALKFFDRSKPEFQEDDFYCAMSIDRFKFVLTVKKENNEVYIFKEDWSM